MSALRKVLVVDDDPVVGKSFNRVLSKDKGYVVITAQNAAEALDRLREQEYDLVFTDIKMPGMDGVELTERVKASQPWTPVVIITGYGTADNETRAKAAGVSDFMRKPLSPEMIEEGAAHALLQSASVLAIPEQAKFEQALPIERIEKHSGFKTAALVLASPLIGLAYALMLPIAGLAMLAWLGARALYAKLATRATLLRVKDITLFLAAPFIGLVYALMLPAVGVGMLVWVGGRTLFAMPAAKRVLGRAKNVCLFAAAPFIGLAYAVMLPLVGVIMLVWVGAQALMNKPVQA
jgi:CheY-like chemotaxis protein